MNEASVRKKFTYNFWDPLIHRLGKCSQRWQQLVRLKNYPSDCRTAMDWLPTDCQEAPTGLNFSVGLPRIGGVLGGTITPNFVCKGTSVVIFSNGCSSFRNRLVSTCNIRYK